VATRKNRSGTGAGRKPGTWGKGQSGNPRGRPPKGETWRDVLSEVLGMSGNEVAEWCDLLAKDYRKVGTVRVRDAIAARVLLALISDPSPSLFREVMERVDGLLPTAPPDDRYTLRAQGKTDAEVERILAEREAKRIGSGAGDDGGRDDDDSR